MRPAVQKVPRSQRSVQLVRPISLVTSSRWDKGWDRLSPNAPSFNQLRPRLAGFNGAGHKPCQLGQLCFDPFETTLNPVRLRPSVTGHKVCRHIGGDDSGLDERQPSPCQGAGSARVVRGDEPSSRSRAWWRRSSPSETSSRRWHRSRPRRTAAKPRHRGSTAVNRR